MMITDRTIQEEKDAAKFKPTRFVVDVGDSRYNYEGDRSGIVYWGYDEVKELWWIRKKLTKRIEYYDHPSSFKSLTVVDMVELARQRVFNPTKNKQGESFYTSLQQHTYGVIINYGDVKYTLYDPIDLMCFSEKVIKFLNNQEMKVDQDHLEDALEFVLYVRVIVKNEAWSGGKGDSSTIMIKCGDSDKSTK
ncbi:hypothetical protein R6Q59_023830 [Mikania micrantha]